MKQHNSSVQAFFDHFMLWCVTHALSMMFNAICPLKTVPWHLFETKRTCFHTIFCITGAFNKLWVQKSASDCD